MTVDEFREPDWEAPIDLAGRLALAPAEQSVKGMFLQMAADEARAGSGRAPGRRSYDPFHDYPVAEWLELLVRSAELAHPGAPVREGLRRLGQKAYSTFAASSIGQVLLSGAGGDVDAVLRQLPRIYRVAGHVGSAEVSFLSERRAIVHLRDLWDFPDCYHVGVFEGGLAALGARATVRVRSLGLSSADLELVWSAMK